MEGRGGGESKSQGHDTAPRIWGILSLEPMIEDLNSAFIRKEGSFLIACWYFVSRVFLMSLLLIIWLVYLFVSKIN